MNNYYYNMPLDSLGRKVGKARGFGRYTNDMLKSLKADLGLFMELDTLIFLRDYYKSNKTDGMLLEELYLFDAIVKGAQEMTANALIGDFLTEDEEIAKTFSDLSQKHRSNKGFAAAPMTLDVAAEVGSLYTRSIGIIPKSYSSLLTEKKAPENTAFLMLTHQSKEASYESYLEAVKSFCESEGFKQAALFIKKIDKRGIAFALASVARGIYGDISSIPCMPEYPELSHLATEGEGKYLVAAPRELIDFLSSIALEHSLYCTYFARGTDFERIKMRGNSQGGINVDIALINALGETKKKSLFLVNKKEYLSANNAVIKAILPSVAAGASLQDITVRSLYRFPASSDNEELRGSCLSAILGAYRAQIELCCAAGKPETEYKDLSTPEAYFASISAPRLSNDLSKISQESMLYLFSFNKGENGDIDYASLRGMCKAVYTAISENKVIAAISIKTNLANALKDTFCEFNVNLDESIPIDIDSDMAGIILVTNYELPNGLPIGTVSAPEISANEPCKEQENEILL